MEFVSHYPSLPESSSDVVLGQIFFRVLEYISGFVILDQFSQGT